MDDPQTQREYRERVLAVVERLMVLADEDRRKLLRLLQLGDRKLYAKVMIELLEREDS